MRPNYTDESDAIAVANEKLQAALERVVRAAAKERRAAEERLTEKQIIEALKQALACGDFARLVRQEDGAQAVTYVPARRVAELESALKAAESDLKYANEVIAELKGETSA